METSESPVLASFSPFVGRRFDVAAAVGTVELELVEAKALRAGAGAPRQDPFSLLFKAEKDCALWQGSVRMEHETMGPLDLFLVPVGEDQDGRYFEAIYN
jgi:hypothetical protein